ncbi:MAG: hypothetical protein RR033_01275 [Clostridia bacterium]
MDCTARAIEALPSLNLNNMLPNYFVQTEFNDSENERKIVKKLLLSSYIIKVLSLTFLFLLFKSSWFLIGFVLTYSIGIAFRQSVLQRIARFEYFYVNGHLKISNVTNFDKVSLLADINVSDIINFDKTSTKNCAEEIVAATDSETYCKITYKDGEKTKNLLFLPSKYLLSLIKYKWKNENDLS